MTAEKKIALTLKNASVLVVEDENFIRELIERMLKGHVGQLHAARSAEDAFYNLEKTPNLAHVAIVDFKLLGKSGLHFIQTLRTSKIPALKALPVVMLTGRNDLDLYRRAARLGISAFLIKPVAPTTLVEALEAALAGRRVAVPRPEAPAVKSAPRAASTSHAESNADEPEDQAAVLPPSDPIDFKA